MPTAEPTETELKLQLAPRHVERFKRSPVLSKFVRTEVAIDNVYFDTPDRLLQRHRMALRVRKIGGRWLQTLKSAGKTSGALTHRGEWETPARAVRGQGQLDLELLSASPLPELLARQKHPVELQPVFRTRVRRTLWVIERADATIEVALDIGEISAKGERTTLREPICEVELELKEDKSQGGAAALIDLAIDLLDAGGKQPLALTPIARSKGERGYQLTAQSRPTAVKASAKGFVQDITAKATTAHALRMVVAHGLAVLTANIELLLRNDDPEYVHQARVALRRVRSAIRLFDRERRDLPQSLADELRWFARALGDARDWDVIADETLPSLDRRHWCGCGQAAGCESRRAAPAGARGHSQSRAIGALCGARAEWRALVHDSCAGWRRIAGGCGEPGAAKRVEEAVQSGAFFRGADTAAAARGENPCEAIALCARFVRRCIAEAGDRALHRSVGRIAGHARAVKRRGGGEGRIAAIVEIKSTQEVGRDVVRLR